ncbi:MAG: double-strand break repair protein AddB [Pseudomonadota bacterium]
MNSSAPRVLSSPPGAPFLPTLADALLSGGLLPGFQPGGNPLALADATIFVPTRRAARALRATFAERLGGKAAILPVIRPLGDVDEDLAWFDTTLPPPPALDPPIDSLERLMLLAPLVQAWKKRLPAHVASLFEEEIVVPTSSAEAIWLARDLAALIDEIETADADWTRLSGIVRDELAAWWQVTLDFLRIVTSLWPEALAERRRSNPAAHRSRLIDAEAERLSLNPPKGPVIAAGSTGSIPATARLLRVISRLPNGAVILPGLDLSLDEAAWNMLSEADAAPSVFGHPQYGLNRLLGELGIARADVTEIGGQPPDLAARAAIVSEALRPAEATETWPLSRGAVADAIGQGALDGVTLVEAANERDEALAIALALRKAAAEPGRRAALVTADRALARRVSAELLRFGIIADDSAGTPLAETPPAAMLRLLVECVMRPGDPVAILSLLKQPLLRAGLERGRVRRAAEAIELVALRGGVGRPDICALADDFEARLLADDEEKRRKPFWKRRLRAAELDDALRVARIMHDAVAGFGSLRGGRADIAVLARATVVAFENVGRSETGGVEDLYRGEAGEKLAGLLRGLVAAEAELEIDASEWPDVLTALIAGETVKPRHGADHAVSIWGALEARLQDVDLLVCGGLNEGSWPGRADPGGFMSRVMKGGLDLDPPERRIGQAAHDFQMAMGARQILLTRSARSGDAPSVPSRWVQRLLALIGEEPAKQIAERGSSLIAEARFHALDTPQSVDFARRPNPAPPLEARPRHFSVTQIETLRRDPYAIYARKVLQLDPLDPLLRDPGAAERGTLFHDILHRFTLSGVDAGAPDAVERLLAIARLRFDEEQLPPDMFAVWWPRFALMAPNLVDWERSKRADTTIRHAEAIAEPIAVGRPEVTLSGQADRIDVTRGGLADILDYKTGSSPSKVQAHRLVSPQLPLEGALMMRGAFAALGVLTPGQLAYVRLRASGEVEEESILDIRGSLKTAADMSEEAWQRLERLLQHYENPRAGYLSRALPFREGDTDGDYDHLARVLEWSAGGDDSGGEGGE